MGRRADIKPLPLLERLRELLSYDQFTGVLTWKKPRQGMSVGAVAGTPTKRGYLHVGIEGVYYLAHRLIWKMMTGSDPVDLIDHEDTDQTNNRWVNLRETSNGPNIQNSKLRCDNASGVKGVHWDAHHKKWRAVLSAKGKSTRLGRYASLEEAITVITQARLEAHGEFARLA